MLTPGTLAELATESVLGGQIAVSIEESVAESVWELADVGSVSDPKYGNACATLIRDEQITPTSMARGEIEKII
jgi:hypothetical protein